jgi:hypothetical protein
MSRIVFWTGPVNLNQVPGATVPGAKAVNVPCTGDGSPTCGQLADSWGITIPGTASSDELFFGAFSAGGSALKRLLLHPEVRAQTRAVMLSDATYTDWAAPGKPLPPEGFVVFGLEAIDGPKMMVATASASPNKTLPNGSQTLMSIKDEIERRSGRKFDNVTLPVSPAPVQAWRLGNVILADYQMTVPHGGQAALAGQFWQKLLVPWLASGAEAPEQTLTEEEFGWVVPFVAGATLGFLTTWTIYAFRS